MQQYVKYYTGIDIAAETFTASIFQSPKNPRITKELMTNSIEGFQQLEDWFKEQQITVNNSVICMEATGVYGEAITHYLTAQGFKVAVEHPLKVKRAFDQDGHKTDAVDSAQIAEYAYRYYDELKFWQPRQETLEKIKHALTVRQHLVKQSVAIQNAIKAYQQHVIQDKLLLDIHHNNLKQVKEHIAKVDAHIKELILQNPSLHQLSQILISVCGVGMLLAAYLIVMTNAFDNTPNYKQFAAFLGICPYKFESGKSVHRAAHCRPFGPAYVRKLLHLAAMSIATHRSEFRKYYLRKVEQGKNKTLVLNNIANKLLKISFALVRDRQTYIKGYRSINPVLLQKA